MSSLSIDSIPSNAVFGGSRSINNYKNASKWIYFFPPFSSTINVWTVKEENQQNVSFVTRTVGARVQTDYTDILVGPPSKKVFHVPKQCY